MFMVNAYPNSPRDMVDSRALHSKPNRSFHYFLPYHDSISPYASYILVGCFFLRKDLESGSSCSQNSGFCVRLIDYRTFCALSRTWLEFVGHRSAIPCTSNDL